jgi:hypothetical protein
VATLATRALIARDANAAARFVEKSLRGTAYFDRSLEIAALAVGGNAEWRAMGSFQAEQLVALACFGPVAGAHDAWRLHVLLFAEVAGRSEIADALIAQVCQSAQAEGARFLLAELPADEEIGFSLTSLRRNGFRQEARIPDFHDDGVALLLLRRDNLKRDSKAD